MKLLQRFRKQGSREEMEAQAAQELEAVVKSPPAAWGASSPSMAPPAPADEASGGSEMESAPLEGGDEEGGSVLPLTSVDTKAGMAKPARARATTARAKTTTRSGAGSSRAAAAGSKAPSRRTTTVKKDGAAATTRTRKPASTTATPAARTRTTKGTDATDATGSARRPAPKKK